MTVPASLYSPLEIEYRDLCGNLCKGPSRKGYINWPYHAERFGHFSCSWIRNYTGCAVYVSQYVAKGLAGWFEKGDQIVMHSKGLNKPELVHLDYQGRKGA